MYLSSRAVSSQVLSTYGALTTVFGMGTGVALPLFTPDWLSCFLATSKSHNQIFYIGFNHLRCTNLYSSPRSISIGQLQASQLFHLQPIKHIIFVWPYSLRKGYLILGHVSRLDAFSAYHFRTQLSSYALDRTTGVLSVRQLRSSRTRSRPLQISYAHDR